MASQPLPAGHDGAGLAFYNERDPFAAQWLRNLIAAGHIAPGVVDERSITEITADDLQGYAQCHFFAGIGVWSHALRRAGWADEFPVWTGSCPCQPFSAAGKRQRFDDERHLWPVWFELIRACRPAIVLGEQVASALDWLDLVSADLEGADYAFGASDLCAAGFSGAHLRQRIYFVAHANGAGLERRAGVPERAGERGARKSGLGYWMGHPHGEPERRRSGEKSQSTRGDGRKVEGTFGQRLRPIDGGASATLGLADADGGDASTERQQSCGEHGQLAANGGTGEGRPGAPTLGRNPADWLFCRDGKWRPVEPGTFPLADAAPQRVGRLRAYGNALDAETATQFVSAVAEALAATPAAGNQLSQPPAVSARPDLGHNPSRNDAEGLGNSHVPHGITTSAEGQRHHGL